MDSVLFKEIIERIVHLHEVKMQKKEEKDKKKCALESSIIRKHLIC